MVRLKVSYEKLEELSKLILILGNSVKQIKTSPVQKGQYKRAYIDLIDINDAVIVRNED